jgi:protein gp37
MSDKSKIEWTDATWNPVTGCTKVSPGCAHCYAEAFAKRFRGVPAHPYEQGFELKLWPARLDLPIAWKERKMIFVNSMSDLFHEDVPEDFIAKVFDVMSQAKHHIFQVLTKRSDRMLDWTRAHFCSGNQNKKSKGVWPKNVWLGVSLENQNYTWRIKHLQESPASIRFISIEPLLSPISLDEALLDDIQWVIVGGESGPRARPMKPEWVYEIRNQCEKYHVPFFFKQWGTFGPTGKRLGKKVAGRVLDGRTWNEVPLKLIFR